MISSVYDINPNYLVKLSGQDELGKAVNIVATMPEEFTLSVEANWEALLPHLGASSLTGTETANKVIQGLTGINVESSQFANTKVWAGTSPINLSMNLTFFALTDAAIEVLAPSQQLLGLVLPSRTTSGTGSMSTLINNLSVKAPGPTLLRNTKNSYKIGLHIGRAYFFPDVIIQSASVTNRSIFGADGIYLVSNVQVDISTTTFYTKEDLAVCMGTSASSYDLTSSINSAMASI